MFFIFFLALGLGNIGGLWAENAAVSSTQKAQNYQEISEEFERNVREFEDFQKEHAFNAQKPVMQGNKPISSTQTVSKMSEPMAFAPPPLPVKPSPQPIAPETSPKPILKPENSSPGVQGVFSNTPEKSSAEVVASLPQTQAPQKPHPLMKPVTVEPLPKPKKKVTQPVPQEPVQVPVKKPEALQPKKVDVTTVPTQAKESLVISPVVSAPTAPEAPTSKEDAVGAQKTQSVQELNAQTAPVPSVAKPRVSQSIPTPKLPTLLDRPIRQKYQNIDWSRIPYDQRNRIQAEINQEEEIKQIDELSETLVYACQLLVTASLRADKGLGDREEAIKYYSNILMNVKTNLLRQGFSKQHKAFEVLTQMVQKMPMAAANEKLVIGIIIFNSLSPSGQKEYKDGLRIKQPTDQDIRFLKGSDNSLSNDQWKILFIQMAEESQNTKGDRQQGIQLFLRDLNALQMRLTESGKQSQFRAVASQIKQMIQNEGDAESPLLPILRLIKSSMDDTAKVEMDEFEQELANNEAFQKWVVDPQRELDVWNKLRRSINITTTDPFASFEKQQKALEEEKVRAAKDHDKKEHSLGHELKKEIQTEGTKAAVGVANNFVKGFFGLFGGK